MKTYYYYHHMLIEPYEREEIRRIILDGDYAGFSKKREYYNSIGEKDGWGKNSYFPDSYFDSKLSKCVTIAPENFSNINEVECECG